MQLPQELPVDLRYRGLYRLQDISRLIFFCNWLRISMRFFNAGDEDVGVEGFGDIVVGAGFQALDNIFFRGFGG